MRYRVHFNEQAAPVLHNLLGHDKETPDPLRDSIMAEVWADGVLSPLSVASNPLYQVMITRVKITPHSETTALDVILNETGMKNLRDYTYQRARKSGLANDESWLASFFEQALQDYAPGVLPDAGLPYIEVEALHAPRFTWE